MATVEPQFNHCLEIDNEFGRTRLGIITNQVWHEDPKRLLFLLSRYKFVSKMISGRSNVLEIGCADAFGTRVVRQSVESVLATDIDPIFIADCKEREKRSPWPISYRVHNILLGPVKGSFDAIYALDVFEHIDPSYEEKFIEHSCGSLTDDGILIIGIPSIESQKYAAPISKEGHVNCKTGKDLNTLFKQYFSTVLSFSMNDEVVHTGFEKMAHYLFIVCSGKKI
jgi:cyclopropane fatty-acyl-phospholipid synthase-like methyltransferase